MSSIWIPKWIFGFIRTGEGGAKCVEVLCIEGGGGGKMCGSTMRRRRVGGWGVGKMCRNTMRRNLHKLTKVFNDVLSKYLKNGLGDLHKTL